MKNKRLLQCLLHFNFCSSNFHCLATFNRYKTLRHTHTFMTKHLINKSFTQSVYSEFKTTYNEAYRDKLCL